MGSLINDLRYAARILLKTPSFTAIALLTLALGIGANTAIFSVVDAVLLRPLPYRDPLRLVHLWETTPRAGFPQREASYPNYLDWLRQNRAFDGIAGYNPTNFNLTGSGDPVRVGGTRVSANFFSVLGVRPFLGRDFSQEEESRAAPRVTIITYGFWQEHFSGAREVLGKTIHLNGAPYSVIGVLPQNFQFALNSNSPFWVTLSMSDDQATRRTLHWFRPIGRLRNGVSLVAAQAEMDDIGRRLAVDYPEANTGCGIRLTPLQEEISGSVRPVLFVLLGAVAVMLLIACANLGGLLLARSTARQREMAIRAALGAAPGRLIRLLLAESFLLSLAGGFLGVLFAWWSFDLLSWLLASSPVASALDAAGLALNLRVLSFTAAVSILTTFFFGLVPALAVARVPLFDSLKESARSSGGIGRRRARSVLVSAEVALALVLLVAAGLLVQSLNRLLDVDPGFDTSNLLTMRVSLPDTRYPGAPEMISFYDRFEQRLAALPGVTAVGYVNSPPLTHDANSIYIEVQGRPALPGQPLEAVVRTASPSYFSMLRVPLRAGRFFSPRDNAEGSNVVLISETFASLFFPGEDPVGKRIVVLHNRSVWEIVGIVGDVKLAGLDAAPRPLLYACSLQAPTRSAYFVVRSQTSPVALPAAARKELASLDAEMPLYSVRTVDEMIASSPNVALRTSVSWLLSGFTLLAVLLAAIGLYALLSHSVRQRTREIGIRVALGAQRGNILCMVFGEGLLLVLAGIVSGAAAAFFLTRVLRTLLFGVSATDPLTFAVVTLILVTVAMLACYIPARRATRTNPIVALRYE